MECLRSITPQTVLDIAFLAKTTRLQPRESGALDGLEAEPGEEDLETDPEDAAGDLVVKLGRLSNGERNELMVLAWMGHEGIPFSQTVWSDLLTAAATQSDEAKIRYISRLTLLDIYLERALKIVDNYQTA